MCWVCHLSWLIFALPCLRRLTDEGKLIRLGAGGRTDPFQYRLTELGLQELETMTTTLTDTAETGDEASQQAVL